MAIRMFDIEHRAWGFDLHSIAACALSAANHPTPLARSTALPVARSTNRLLASIPDDDFARWAPRVELVDLHRGQVLHESHAPTEYVYFPTTCMVSILYVLANGATTEVAVVGKEGIVGISQFMGGESTPTRAVVLSDGSGYRLSSSELKTEIESAGPVLSVLLRYTQALIAQVSQTAVCNRHHSIRQQFCRWLLLSLDRVAGDELVMTQELIANMLGVRREGITAEALRLQAEGALRYHRGHITVLDRSKLAANACECYSAISREYERLFP